MKQSVQITHILWSILAIVLVTFFGFGNISSSQTTPSYTFSGPSQTTPSYTFSGPSHDYMMTPDPCSLTYSGGCRYQRIMLPQMRQELAMAE